MFGLSFTHLLILAVIALVFIGPEQLPEVARTLARLLNEWKRATGEIQSSLTNTLRDDVMLKREQNMNPNRTDLTPPSLGASVDVKDQPLEAEVKPEDKKS